MNQKQLHHKLRETLQSIGIKATAPQLTNIAYGCQALAFTHHCHLSSLATRLPLNTHREHQIQRLRRFLKNETLKLSACYSPLVEHVLTSWPQQELCLVMDRTDIKDKWSILMVGAAYKKRVIPLAWDVLSFGGTAQSRQIGLLKRIKPYVRTGMRVVFLGDSEFRGVLLQQYCQQQGWHWQVGVKSDTWYEDERGSQQPLSHFTVKKGERRYLSNIKLTKEKRFGPVNLIADWTSEHKTARYWVIDRPANRHAWRVGRKRYWIEPTFRDWKSYGFDLEQVKINDQRRLDNLLLLVCLTTTWMLSVGHWVTSHGYRPFLAPKKRMTIACFGLGGITCNDAKR